MVTTGQLEDTVVTTGEPEDTEGMKEKSKETVMTTGEPIVKVVIRRQPEDTVKTTGHWCLKSKKSGFTRAKVPCLKNLVVLLPRIDAQKGTNNILHNTKKNV